ncbi:D-2-hydroxyacid dehydrogenase [Solirhodobacter olei]|uniref:D-2-hydroxyacid dehydrogenase n=1 Tax=Solirhodobacter olei TaxID=2493082 RepID=UPI000FD9E164|nr:D-2-hydroxyacid dehydrogenase [Solirhodobacter olei]
MSDRPIVLLHTDGGARARQLLAETHPDLSVHLCDSHEGMKAALAETQAEVVYSMRFPGTAPYPREALMAAPALRWIAVGGSGTDHLRPWDPARITVTNSAGVASEMMAECVMGAMLHFAQNRHVFAQAQRRREWLALGVEPVAGRTALIVGLGKTGAAVARRAKAAGLVVLGCRARPRPTPDVDEVHGEADLLTLLPRADFVAVCVPLNESTRGLFGPEAFAAMKPGAVLIDVSRGGVVSGAALVAALEGGRLKGAALDVFETEPLPPEDPLWSRENVLITPHCSAVYPGWEEGALRIFAENLRRYRRGEPLENIVDPVRGY